MGRRRRGPARPAVAALAPFAALAPLAPLAALAALAIPAATHATALPSRGAVSTAIPVADASDLRPPQRSPDEVRRVVRSVLARPEYHRNPPDPIERARRWVRDRLEQLLADALNGRLGLLGLAVLALLLASIVFLAVRFGRRLTPDPAPTSAAVELPRRAAADWLAEAESYERAGAWRLALRCRYRALVAELGARGLVEEVAGRTAGEYRTEVDRNVPAVAEAFAGATELFERAWYGNYPTGPAEADRFGELSGAVLARQRVLLGTGAGVSA